MEVLYRCQYCKEVYENIEDASKCEAPIKELNEKYPKGMLCSVTIKSAGNGDWIRLIGTIKSLEFENHSDYSIRHGLKGATIVYNDTTNTVASIFVKADYLDVAIATAQLMSKAGIEKLP